VQSHVPETMTNPNLDITVNNICDNSISLCVFLLGMFWIRFLKRSQIR